MSLRNTRVPIGEEGYEESFMNGDFLKVEALPNDAPIETSGFYRIKNSPHPLEFKFRFRRMTVSWIYEPEREPVTIWVNVSPINSADWRENQDYASIALYNGIRKLIRTRYPECSSKEVDEKMKQSVLLRAPVVTYGYAITGHKSQGGEWKDVWVDYRYAQNRQTDDYFRWAYTVTTRAKERLYAIAPPCFDNLADILNIEINPFVNVTNDVATKPLPEIVSAFKWKVTNVVPRPFAYRVFLDKSDASDEAVSISGYVDILFNGKNIVTKVDIHLQGVEEKLNAELKAIVGMTTKAALEDSNVANPTPKSSQSSGSQITSLNELHVDSANRIKEATDAAGFTLVSAKSLNDYQLRITIDHGNGTGSFDVYFDGKGRVSKLGQFTLPVIVLQAIRKGL